MSRPLPQLESELPDTGMVDAPLPVVIVGNGPAGVRAARELLRRKPDVHVILYGDEPYLPYNRIKLSSFLAGKMDWEELMDPVRAPAGADYEERFGIEIRHIDPGARVVEEAGGRRQPYQCLILATGSRPHVPNIPGIDLPGVYTFRNLDDTQQLLARQARSHRTVVLGGGLLGMEAARGMQRGNTRVSLIEHADRLLGAQLDEAASALLQARLEALGIAVHIGNGVRGILGTQRVEGVQLLAGEELACDTVIVATGIRPRIELAREAGIAVGRGIRVDDCMQTSQPGVYAIGECAEHRERVYGLVAPGLEQAAVAASHIIDRQGGYRGSLVASRLKVVDCPVFSAGPMGARDDNDGRRSLVYGDIHADPHGDRQGDPAAGLYRRIKLQGGRLVGAIGIGAWAEDVRLQQVIARRQRVWPWQLWRFRRYGRLWPETEQQGVGSWPAGAAVCQCTGASRGAIDEAIVQGAVCLESVGRATGAGTVCGSCRPLVQELLGATAAKPVPWARTLLLAGSISVLAVLAILLLPPVPYAQTVQVPWRWDVLWRDGLLKQITGFSVLGLFLAGLLISPRKRLTSWQALGRFDGWRLLHILLGLLVVIGLLIHTGGRAGSGLDGMLMLAFGLTLLLGGFASGVIGLEHRLAGQHATQLRRRTVWWHILAFWPVPVLLGYHVLKGYWF